MDIFFLELLEKTWSLANITSSIYKASYSKLTPWFQSLGEDIWRLKLQVLSLYSTFLLEVQKFERKVEGIMSWE